ncbi:MAG: AraC family transcriptional regulator [Clostridium sp.]|nr:AraC family transcriptional regulator [Clostridium sp.]
MSRPKRPSIEYRNYLLPAYFPIILLRGEEWRISDIPSGVLHFHNCLEIGLCESHEGTMEFDGKPLPFQAGDVTVVASDVPHTTYSAPGAASKWSYLFVNVEELFYPYFPLEIISNPETLQRLLQNCSAILPQKDYPEIYTLVTGVMNELERKETNFSFSVRGLMLSLMMKLMNIYSEAEKGITDNIQLHENSLAISPALRYIRKNYMQDFSIESLAAICRMSPAHFRRTFHSIMGTTAIEHLNRTRIEKAAVLLRTTEEPVLSISEEVGYRSISSFNRHFLDMEGVTPLEYRKQMSFIRNQSILKCTGWLTPPSL